MKFIYCVLLIGAVLTGFTFIGAVEVTARHIFFLLAVALVTMIGNRIFVNDRQYMTLWVGLSFIGCSLFFVTWLSGLSLEYWQINTFIGFCCSATNFVILFVASIPGNRWSRMFKFVVFMVVFAPVFAIWAYFLATGGWINDSLLLAQVIQMDFKLLVSVMINSIGMIKLSALLIIWIWLSYAFSGCGRLIYERMTAVTIIGCVMFVLLNGALLYRTHGNIVVSCILDAIKLLQ